MGKVYDFSGYATKNNLRCADNRTIMKDAFKDQDGTIVPLVYQHLHDNINNVLGHAVLENREDGVYCYGYFNDSEDGKAAKARVQHGDITQMSIYANKLVQRGGDVLHGVIREVSLVLAGANPGARIDNVSLQHSDGYVEELDDEVIIKTGINFALSHSADDENDEDDTKEDDESMKKDNNGEKTIKEIFDTFTDEQLQAVYAVVGEVASGDEDDEDEDDNEGEDDNIKHSIEGGDYMRFNAFEGSAINEDGVNTLTHDQMASIISDGKKFGTLKESFISHAQDYGIENIEYLFPDARTIEDRPDFIKREMDWVPVVMNGTHHTPFSRIKSIHADITEDEARARGYLKGKKKLEEVFSLLKRTTDPQTIYKKQKLDRDDVIDITDFDVVAWIKTEMRMMLDEELARAVLVGDGRLSSSDDKIQENHVRPIWKDDDLYTIKVPVTVASSDDSDTKAKNAIKAIIRARKDYKGSGNPTAFITEDLLTDMLLLEDGIGHPLYKTVEELATKLRVSKIVTVPIMENLTREGTGDDAGKVFTLGAIIVNLNDYNIGADKGGAVSMFEDFDIDYNQQKYLIETRISGALTKPFSAMAVEFVSGGAAG